MSSETAKRIIEAAADELERKNAEIVLHLDCATACCVAAQLDLALRHPANRGHPSEVARELSAAIKKRLPPKTLALILHGELARAESTTDATENELKGGGPMQH